MNKKIVTLLCVLFCVSMVGYSGYKWGDVAENRRITLGLRTLRSLYEFEDLTQFGENLEVFRSLTTPEVFEQMSADNSDRILRVYLKFNGKPSYVNVLEAHDRYIIYSLVCESIERERVFMCVYEVTNGKISELREGELFPFPTTRGWEVDYQLLPPQDLPYGGE